MMSNNGQVTAEPLAGWYPHPDRTYSDAEMYWDGIQWHADKVRARIGHSSPIPAHQSIGPMTSSQINVRREAIYTRQQKGHSVILHTFLALVTACLSLPWTIYYAVSPNHYFHA